MPWVTNLRPDGFLVAAAVTAPDGTPAVGAAAGHRRPDAQRRPAPAGLQSSNTAALEVKGVRISPRWLIHADARQYLPQARPASPGCNAARPSAWPGARCARPRRRGRAGARAASWPSRWRSCRPRSSTCRTSSSPACARGRCGRALAAVRGPHRAGRGGAAGGAAGAAGRRRGLPEAGRRWFARRWREAAFLPIVTPSLVQLKTELASAAPAWPPRRRHERRHERRRAGAARARPDAALSGADAAVFQDVNLTWRVARCWVLGASGPASPACCACWAAGAQRRRARHGRPAAAGVHPRVAVAFQDPGLLPWLTLERNVAFGLDFKHQPALDGASARGAWTGHRGSRPVARPPAAAQLSGSMGAAPRWRAAWPASRRCCCWTSRSGRWTRSRAPRCRRCCARWWPTSAPPRC